MGLTPTLTRALANSQDLHRMDADSGLNETLEKIKKPSWPASFPPPQGALSG
jgi:hypothetical protein